MTADSGRRTLLIDALEADHRLLDHLARATGRPKPEIADRLLHAALHADGLVHEVTEAAKASQPADDPDDDWPPMPAA